MLDIHQNITSKPCCHFEQKEGWLREGGLWHTVSGITDKNSLPGQTCRHKPYTPAVAGLTG